MEALLAALRAAGEPTRLRVLCLLGHGELTVSELTRILAQSQPRVSRHLRLMCDAGLLERHREGAWVFYRLAQTGAAAKLARAIITQVPEDESEHQRDLERLAKVREDRASEAQAYFRANATDWDRIRALYVPEEQVEQQLLGLVANRKMDSLLDVGTGTGRMLELFAPQIRQGLGIDMSTEMLALARSRLISPQLAHCQVRLGDMYDLPVDTASQDLVILHQVLHFAPDPEAVITEAARTLRPGGQLLVVDFLPHEKEFLREDHAHRRLGFSDREVSQWASTSHLTFNDPVHLDGGELTVGIWSLALPAIAPAKEAAQ